MERVAEIKAIIDSSESWEDLEEKIIHDPRSRTQAAAIIESAQFPWGIDFESELPLSDAPSRMLFVESVRLLTYLANENKTTTSRIVCKDTYVIDDIELTVYGIVHDKQGLKEISHLQEKVIVTEPGLNRYYKSAKEMPRNDEFRFLSLSERVGLILKMGLFIMPYHTLWTFFSRKKVIEKVDTYWNATLGTQLPPSLERAVSEYVVKDPQDFLQLDSSDTACSLRSLGQVEFVLDYAQKKKSDQVTLVVGAKHSQDIRLLCQVPGLREYLKSNHPGSSFAYAVAPAVEFGIKAAIVTTGALVIANKIAEKLGYWN